MQTYIKKCGGKQVLTGLWKNLCLCLKKKKRNKSVALSDFSYLLDHRQRSLRVQFFCQVFFNGGIVQVAPIFNQAPKFTVNF
jgi:hypothetical protein